MKVRCVKFINEGTGEIEKSSPWLTINKSYTVLEVHVDERRTAFRLQGDCSSTPAYHDACQFEIVSNVVPEHWCIQLVPGRYFSLLPREWAADGFWEAYFNCDPEAERIFKEVSTQLIESEF